MTSQANSLTLGVIVSNRDFFPDVLITEARRDLNKLLDERPDRHRLPIVYVKLEGLSVKEAAQMTGMSESARLAAAQAIILGEVNKEFGGVAEAGDHFGAAVAQAPAVIFCANCGQKVEGNFCMGCGTPRPGAAPLPPPPPA